MFFIGIDPHKASHTAAVLDGHEQLVSEVRVRADRSQRDRLLDFAAEFEPRCWAIEGASGTGALLAQQLGAADFAEELNRETSTFDADRVGGLDAPQLGGSPGGRKASGEPSRDELTQEGVEATDHAGAMRDQVMVTFREKTQHRRVILEPNHPQSRVPQPHDRGRAGIVRVGLVTPCVVEEPHPRRERGRHVEHGLTDRDEG